MTVDPFVPTTSVQSGSEPDCPERSFSHSAIWADLRETRKLLGLGIALGWLDIKLRYRGSVLGPFWLTVVSSLMVVSMGGLYSTLFHMNLTTYLPFLAVSLMLWQAGIAAQVQDSCGCFIEAEAMIRASRLPLPLFAVRVVVRNVIIFAHNIVVPLGVFAFYHAWPGVAALWALPAAALWVIDGWALCLLLGALCARYRDIPPIVGALMQVVFYVTPIIWAPVQLHGYARFLLLNPFYAVIEILRQPLLGQRPDTVLWEIALGASVLLCGAAALVYSKARARVVFWM
ncbi:ABC transporter permease [Neokomagataea sp. TBRC 2177]|uniref:ABC transporter permease n=2 Tax=Neokomagataea anthophila TaxID=2826925 RepID=A0ABS5E8B4_9PROT|nr:ABC transporter permease [Neokomagataea anthophila]MBR0560148.1 ABC transporter permease [Neokomagataea anthophila]